MRPSRRFVYSGEYLTTFTGPLADQKSLAILPTSGIPFTSRGRSAPGPWSDGVADPRLAGGEESRFDPPDRTGFAPQREIGRLEPLGLPETRGELSTMRPMCQARDE